MAYKNLIVAVISVVAVCVWVPQCLAISRGEFLEELSKRIENEQIRDEVPFGGIGQWREIEGNYRNYYMTNFRGGPLLTAARHKSMVLDMDVFASHFTIALRLEGQKFGNASLANETEIERTVRMLGRYQDHNRPNTSLMMFYPQSYDNETGVWFADPKNLYSVSRWYDDIMPISLVQTMLGPAPLPGGLENAYTPEKMSDALQIATDFDSTFINLNLGGLLYDAREDYPDAWRIWDADNPDVPALFEQVKKYAYRPFSDDRNQNSIDARSYYVMREFLDQAQREGRDVALVPTYAQNVEELRTQYDQKIVSLGCVNTVGLGVQLDIIAGFFLAFDSGLVDWDILANDTDLELVINSTASLIIYELQTNLTDRPDLAAHYYPSTMLLYWFTAWTLMHMETSRQRAPLVPVFATYYDSLKSVMTANITDTIVDLKQDDPSGGFFYDDFLGTSDFTADGESVNHAEDRVFTTAMAANALLFTWSVYNGSQQTLEWREGVPDSVKDVIKGCVLWLEANTLGGKYPLTNAFFSADIKNRKDMGYLYPGNRFEYLNGTSIGDFSYLPMENTIYAMEGHVTEEEYERLLQEERFGLTFNETALTFHGYNVGQGSLGLWSAESMTYGGVLLAVSMVDFLEG